MNNIRSIRQLLRSLAIVLAAAILCESLAEALFHLRDLSQINHIAGIWMTLAQQLRDGVFYPPIEQDGYYAGTRYMPLLFVLLAGLSRLTGDYLLAAKLVSLLTMLGLLAAVFTAARRITQHSLDALILAAAVLAFPEGRHALLAPHADALSVALSVAGLIVLSGPRRTIGHLAMAALLFALAVSTKLTALSGCAAACVFLMRHERRSTLVLAAMSAAVGIAGFTLMQLWSDGRFVDNFRAVASGGMTAGALFDGPVRLTQAVIISTEHNFVTAIVILPALLALLRNALEWRFDLWDWYFFFALASTVLIFASPGTDLNHLLELEVAGLFVLAGWLRRQTDESGEFVALGVVAVALVCGLVYSGRIWMANPQKDEITARTLIEALPKGGQLLTEDATPAVLLGQRPAVMDPFAYRLLVERGRINPDSLPLRVRNHEFTALVLIRRIDDPAHSLAPQFHFGTQLTDAILESYRFEKRIGAYFLYVPKKEMAATP